METVALNQARISTAVAQFISLTEACSTLKERFHLEFSRTGYLLAGRFPPKTFVSDLTCCSGNESPLGVTVLLLEVLYQTCLNN